MNLKSKKIHTPNMYNIDDSGDMTSNLQDMFDQAQGQIIILPESMTYSFTRQLIVRANTRVISHRVTFQLNESIDDKTPAIFLEDGVQIDYIDFYLPKGHQLNRAIQISNNCQVDRIRIISEDQQNNRNSTIDGALRIFGENVYIGEAIIQRFDNAVVAYKANGVHVDLVYARHYTRGIFIDQTIRFSINEIDVAISSENATTLPGHNGVLIEHSQHGYCNRVSIQDAGEHGWRIGGQIHPPHETKNIITNNIDIARSGQCGIKINPDSSTICDSIHFGNVTIKDCAYGNKPGTNEEGVRLEHCQSLTFNSVTIEKKDKGQSCYQGLFCDDVIGLHINSMSCKDIADAAVVLTDKSGQVNRVFIDSLIAENCGTQGIRIENDQQSNYRHIVIRGIYLRAYGLRDSVYGIFVDNKANVLQPMIFNGYIQNTSYGTFYQSNPDRDIVKDITPL